LGSGVGINIRHVAACPEIDPVTCESQDLPVHYHEQRLSLVRTTGRFSLGLGRGVQVAVDVPLDFKASTIDYVLEDGSTYEPPYGNIHHRNETLKGLADASLMLQGFAMVTPQLLLGGGIGSSLPLGRTYDNPYALASQGLEHQHLQMGTGSFVPSLEGYGVFNGMRLGGLGYVRLRLPVYENNKGYKPPPIATLGLGPSWRVTPRLQVLSSAVLGYEGGEEWSDESTDNEGKLTLSSSVGLLYMAGPNWVLQGSAQLNLWQQDLGARQVEQDLVLTLGVSRTFSRAGHQSHP
jgi:hypothetical protein